MCNTLFAFPQDISRLFFCTEITLESSKSVLSAQKLKREPTSVAGSQEHDPLASPQKQTYRTPQKQIYLRKFKQLKLIHLRLQFYSDYSNTSKGLLNIQVEKYSTSSSVGPREEKSLLSGLPGLWETNPMVLQHQWTERGSV